MTNLNFNVVSEKCIGCDACVNDCPHSIISRVEDQPPIIVSEKDCLECQHCFAVCPTGAISIFGLKPEDSFVLTTETLPTFQQMKTLIRGRRSVRQFREENVPCELIEEILADTAHAPTGCNDCDLTFTVVDKRNVLNQLLEQLVKMLEDKNATSVTATVPEFLLSAVVAYRQNGTDEFFRGAPHLLVISAGKKAHTPQEDIALTLANFELLAQSAGLGTTWCGMLKFAIDIVPEFRVNLGLERDCKFYAMMFGYPAVRYARTVQRNNAAIVRRIGN
ncbi:MAG: nitroreductase family protein [Planctomycetaceae bacterium]|jgi:Fe-S-cluster-containing hydrogenase component 2|nr:nitroreductase family protein [Planctomycetaceae bacterium]